VENHIRSEAQKKATKKHPASAQKSATGGGAKNPFENLRHEYLDNPGK
jgi:hypothetical protein